jgi:hypothetical protein
MIFDRSIKEQKKKESEKNFSKPDTKFVKNVVAILKEWTERRCRKGR